MTGSWKDALDAETRKDLKGMYNSYDIIGDIIVTKIPRNLDHLRCQIGESILEANPSTRLVLQVVGETSSEIRTRKMRRIAGKGPTVTQHREYATTYFVDPTRVFFTPRLSYERWRITQQVKNCERIVNMFAGVGCYSLLIARFRNSTVFSVDKNPFAIEYMKKSIEINNLMGEVIPLLGDAREVCKRMSGIDRVILALPAIADDFLDLAIRISSDKSIIHLYRESMGDRKECLKASKREVKKIFSTYGGSRLRIQNSRVVRSIGPKKWHVVHDVLHQRVKSF